MLNQLRHVHQEVEPVAAAVEPGGTWATHSSWLHASSLVLTVIQSHKYFIFSQQLKVNKTWYVHTKEYELAEKRRKY